MLLFTNCYTNDGYLPCCMHLPDGDPEATNKQQMLQLVPAEIVWLMTACDIPFYSGVLLGRRVVQIRNIPTRFKDENRRNCFIHLTFIDMDEDMQGRLTSYVLDDYPDFVQQVNHMICYAGKRYEVSKTVLEQLFGDVQKQPVHALQEDRAIVVAGETSAEYFCTHNVLGIQSSMDADWEKLPAVDVNQLPMPQRKGKDSMEMTLYFYCSSPQEGYHFRQVEPLTGDTLANELTEKIGLDPLIYRMITSSGANMALCHRQNTHTFFARRICSQGKNERFGLVLQNAEEELTRQFAAWAVFDYSSFCDAVTACIEVDGGTCAINPEQVQHLMQINWTADPRVRQSAVWKTLTTPKSNGAKPYSLLVVDYDIQDFNSNLNMSVDKTMVECLLNVSQLNDLRQKISEQSIPLPDEPTGTSPLSRERSATPEHAEEKKPAPPIVAHNKPQDNKNDAPKQSNVTITTEDESVDLLHTKWFIPAAIGVGVLAVLACIVIIVSRGKAGAAKPNASELGTVIETVITDGDL